MTRLPGLRDELVAAARRGRGDHRKPPRPRSRSWVLLATTAACVATAGTAAAVVVTTGAVGQRPSAPYRPVAAEEQAGMRRERAPVVLATTRLSDGATAQLVGYRMRGYAGRGELLCLDLSVSGGSRGGGCDSKLPGRANGLLGTTDAAGRPVGSVAVGATRSQITKVTVSYRRHGRRARTSALLLPVSSRAAALVGARRFTYYAAELPDAARPITAVALAADGTRRWSASFGPRLRSPRRSAP